MSIADTAPEQEVSLLDQMKYVTYGHTIADVMVVSVILMQQCLVQRASSKKQALRALDAFYIKMAEDIDQNYESMRSEQQRQSS